MEVTLKMKEEVERLFKVGFIIIVKYIEWLSNIVSMIKKNRMLHVCVDFKDLNKTTLKDEYLILITDILIDTTAQHSILLSFIDGHSRYNQISIAEEDVHKMAFQCLGPIIMFE